MPLRKHTRDSASNILRGNAVSFTCIVVGLINIALQFTVPDIVPDAINRYIANSQDSGMVALYTLFLYLWVFGGIVLVIGGLTAIIVKRLRG